MPNQVTDAKVKRISFVRRAATRDPRDPTQPRRVLLWKSEDAAPERRRVTLWKATDTPDLDERNPMPTLTQPLPLSKRAIDRPATAPPATRPYTEAEVEAKEADWAPLLTQMHRDLQEMRSDADTPQHAVQRHEKAYGELHAAYVGLRDPETATRLDGRWDDDPDATDGERAMLVKAEALQKSDSTLSSLEALKAAMRADPSAYFAQSGTARPAHAAPLSGVVNAPKRDVKVTPTEGLSAATDLAREIQQREGVSAAEAMRRAMRDPAIAADYAAERGGAAAAA